MISFAKYSKELFNFVNNFDITNIQIDEYKNDSLRTI